ncbi:YARHG domain-containing protein [Flavobacterium sp. ABG]|uniref:YARHG domain-containing protein n=1 Tax=Flavobacterium sp. ABG TaxID=1423322 RepID=UPI00064AB77B|nr:YARHG domain-containing protein [Flavobacterium sp. ABG]KLT68549.1 hypothetical protein AB674_17115 [Flavobacterium sp. ABG]
MKNFFYLLLAVLLYSCNSKEKQIAQNENLKNENKEDTEIRTDLYGSWVGDFMIEERDTTREAKEGINKINILIKKITESEVIGQSIVAGNNRPLKGKIIKKEDRLIFTLDEPGDDKNDGAFVFEVINDTIVGIWTAYNDKKEVTKRSFKLTKKEFKYDPNVMLPDYDTYIDFQNPKIEKEKSLPLPDDTIARKEEEYDEYDTPSLYRQASESVYQINSSTTKLKESQLKNLKKLDLEILRNTIFARHGLTFKTKGVRQFFDFVDWYIPISSNVDDQLTETEKQNIVLLKRFEKYATDNYDSFGR